MRKHLYLCVDLKTYTQQTPIRPGETRIGSLEMTEEGEQFFFCEALREHRTRNPKVWKGQRLNVARSSEGKFVVNLRRIELGSGTDPLILADEIFVELQAAMAALGL